MDTYEKVKRLITDASALAFYNPSRPTVVSADASSYDIRAAQYKDVAGELKQNRESTEGYLRLKVEQRFGKFGKTIGS